jgi:hypothetical protein
MHTAYVYDAPWMVNLMVESVTEVLDRLKPTENGSRVAQLINVHISGLQSLRGKEMSVKWWDLGSNDSLVDGV